MLDPDATIISPPRASEALCISTIVMRPHGAYTSQDIASIVGWYFRVATPVGVDPVIAIAQMIHETGNLTSALSQRRDKDGRDLRNPAGIGVWEGKDRATPYLRYGCVWDADAQGYRPACGFANWASESIPAHVGRLLAYATSPTARTPQQAEAVRAALRFRDLPLKCHGSAPTLRLLGTTPNAVDGCGWASPGERYGAALAAVANRIIRGGA